MVTKNDLLVERFEHAGRTVCIYRDPEPMSPRDYDNLAVLSCWHRRYVLGDEEKRIEPMNLDALREKVKNEGDEILAVLALFLYDHSGITMRAAEANPFHDRWDSGQVGWAYVTKAGAEAMGCVGELWDEARLLGNIRGEVAAYDEYLTGQVYGYEVIGRGRDILNDCWGLFGLDSARGEAKSAAENSDDPADDRDAAELAERPTFAGPVFA
jgi:hypothetical protein